MMHSFLRQNARRAALCLLMVGAISACGGAATPAPTPGQRAVAAAFCAIRVDGRRIVDGAGRALVLHGAALGSIGELQAAGLDPAAEIDRLAAAGASVVRMAVRDEDITPSFVAEQLLPVVVRANETGVVLILSWRNDSAQRLNKQADGAEDFVRLLIPALRGFDGVWLDPIDVPLDQPLGKQRAVAERMLNVARGMGDARIIVVNHATWLASDDVAINQPFTQGNVLYGVNRVGMLDSARVPVYVTQPADASAVRAAVDAGIGVAFAAGSAGLFSESDANALWSRSQRCTS